MTTPSARNYGYVRVSTAAQTNDRQVAGLTAAGIDPDHIYSDKISGTRQSRPGLDEMLKHVRDGDTITVTSLDRFGRSALHVLQTISNLSSQGVVVKSLKAGEDFGGGATARMMASLMVLVSEWELEMNRERVAEARAARKGAPGQHPGGRPRTALLPPKIDAVRKLHASGTSTAEIVKTLGMSRASVYRCLAKDA